METLTRLLVGKRRTKEEGGTMQKGRQGKTRQKRSNKQEEKGNWKL